jgi:hypothetical protein
MPSSEMYWTPWLSGSDETRVPVAVSTADNVGERRAELLNGPEPKRQRSCYRLTVLFVKRTGARVDSQYVTLSVAPASRCSIDAFSFNSRRQRGHVTTFVLVVQSLPSRQLRQSGRSENAALASSPSGTRWITFIPLVH